MSADVPGLAAPWVWVQPKDDAELIRRLGEARDYAVHERERENLCSVAHDRLEELVVLETRFKAMLPLFEEARDALPAIPLANAKLHGLRLDLADRMDDVGVPSRWKALQEKKA